MGFHTKQSVWHGSVAQAVNEVGGGGSKGP